MEEKRKRISDFLRPEDIQEVLRSVSVTEEIQKLLESDRDEIRRILEAERERLWEEATKNAPPGSFGELLDLIAIVQDKAPEAGEALDLLIKRHFQRRRVLYITSERLRLEAMWKLELSLDEWGELKPHSYKDEAPLALLETINVCGDFLLGELRHRMKKYMRNEIVRGGAQGRNIDIEEVEKEYRLKEISGGKSAGDDEGRDDITDLPNLSKWDSKEGFFINQHQYNNLERKFQRSTYASPAYRADPWDPREVVDIPEEDRPLWEAICKAIPLLDDIDQALVKSIMYKIPITKLSKDTGIPEGTLRSRKSRLLAKFRKNATKEPSLSVLYIGKESPAKSGQAPTRKMDLRRPKKI